MLPFIMHPQELEWLSAHMRTVAEAVMQERQATVEYSIGTMIELPAAALRAREIAPHAAYFSFGTNDLTQTTLGISRDDSAALLQVYQERGLLTHDPFVTLDQETVGVLVKQAVDAGRMAHPAMHFGLCGEHGGDPMSVMFCHRIGLDYVSCSPYRVPVARLAAAHAALSVLPVSLPLKSPSAGSGEDHAGPTQVLKMVERIA